jgi:hypothetical protein
MFTFTLRAWIGTHAFCYVVLRVCIVSIHKADGELSLYCTLHPFQITLYYGSNTMCHRSMSGYDRHVKIRHTILKFRNGINHSICKQRIATHVGSHARDGFFCVGYVLSSILSLACKIEALNP